MCHLAVSARRFPFGCGAAKSAMKDRLEDIKPPLPPFSSRAVSADGSSGGSNMSSTYGFGVYVEER
ncbi:hypothetical protein GCM10023339_81450 [Alloalcanivorax gelatiniphagus]|jgi:hypothetical protein